MTHKEYLLNAWIEFYTRWAYAPLWKWVVQITYLISLGFLLYISSNALVYWMQVSEPTPINELIFFGWIFGIVFGLIGYRFLYSNVAFYVITKLGLDE